MFTQVRSVYVIVCVPIGEVYVGSSGVTGTRMSQHRTNLRRGTHHNAGLQAAWNTYGEAAFQFAVLQVLPFPGEDALTEAEVTWVEALSARVPGMGLNRDAVHRRTVSNRAEW